MMEKYEQISDTCKIKWIPNFNLTIEKYTQVSGYIFNEKNELLIVKNKEAWTIPGGHPELYEYTIGTLIREIMEEACVTIKDIEYLGAVEVVENNKKYYQLRYFGRIKEIYEFKDKWEVSERKFVKLDDLPKYIVWANGETFKKQVETAKKYIMK